jgi:hypothetical protein
MNTVIRAIVIVGIIRLTLWLLAADHKYFTGVCSVIVAGLLAAFVTLFGFSAKKWEERRRPVRRAVAPTRANG